jgi:hypothetical protein
MGVAYDINLYVTSENTSRQRFHRCAHDLNDNYYAFDLKAAATSLETNGFLIFDIVAAETHTLRPSKCWFTRSSLANKQNASAPLAPA